MDLRGAKIRNIYELSANINENKEIPLRALIPFYQRPYKWDSEKIGTLINDFYSFNETNSNEDKRYFVGSVLTVEKEEFSELIDGQQRITTIFLANYVKFLFLRSYICELIYSREMTLEGTLKELIKSSKYLFFENLKELEQFKDEVIEEIDDENKMEYLDKYKSLMKLPNIAIDCSEYGDSHKNGLSDYFKNKKFCLGYMRENYNERLKKALSSVRIDITSNSGPHLEYEESEDKILKQYIDAIITIFSSFKDKASIRYRKPLKIAKELNKLLGQFIENISFCVIHTGNTNDAYTLFEVLNDRALALDDLDLIKNSFYKTYCQVNKNLVNDIEIDDHIETLEKKWELAFSENHTNFSKKMVSFLGTVFLTGNNNLNYKNDGYRESINIYLSNKKNYEFKEIEREFEYFHIIKFIMDETYLKKQYASIHSLEIENKGDTSIVPRCLRLLNSLQYHAILPGVINLIINYFNKKIFDIKCEKTYFNQFKIFYKHLSEINSDENQENLDLFKIIDNLYRLTLLSKTYSIPKKYSDEIVNKHNSKSNSFELIHLPEELINDSRKEAEVWLSDWKKSSSNANQEHKVKLVFIRMLQMNLEMQEEKPFFNKQKTLLSIKKVNKINLDHIEPRTIDKNKETMYFVPENLERSDFVEKLGNFMLLENGDNTSKSNEPAYMAPQYYENMGFGNHWFINELKKDLEKFSNEVDFKKNTGEILKINIPNTDFFNKRLQKNKRYFISVMDMKFNETEKEISDSL